MGEGGGGSEAPAMESLVRAGLHPWQGAHAVAVQHQGRLAAMGMVAVSGIFEGMETQVVPAMDGVREIGCKGGERRGCQQEGSQYEQDEGLFCHRELLEMNRMNQVVLRREWRTTPKLARLKRGSSQRMIASLSGPAASISFRTTPVGPLVKPKSMLM